MVDIMPSYKERNHIITTEITHPNKVNQLGFIQQTMINITIAKCSYKPSLRYRQIHHEYPLPSYDGSGELLWRKSCGQVMHLKTSKL